MMKKPNPNRSTALHGIVVLFFILMFCSNNAVAKVQTEQKQHQHVLIVHSYHQSFLWCKDISTGIDSILQNHAHPISRYFIYLDSKRIGNMETWKKHIITKTESFAPIKLDLIIATDDNALNALLAIETSLIKNTPIVFCGLNKYSPDLLKIHPEMTGIVQVLPYKKALTLVEKLYPHSNQIAIITKNTAIGPIERHHAAKNL